MFTAANVAKRVAVGVTTGIVFLTKSIQEIKSNVLDASQAEETTPGDRFEEVMEVSHVPSDNEMMKVKSSQKELKISK